MHPLIKHIMRNTNINKNKKTIQSAKSSGVHIWFNGVLANSF